MQPRLTAICRLVRVVSASQTPRCLSQGAANGLSRLRCYIYNGTALLKMVTFSGFLSLWFPDVPAMQQKHVTATISSVAMKLFWATSLLYIVPIRAAQSCYFPNGSPSPGTAPCDPDAENSMCCDKSQGAFCLSNKLCRGPDGNLIRGACTDRNWAAPECAYYCLSMFRFTCSSPSYHIYPRTNSHQAQIGAATTSSPAPMLPTPTHHTAATATATFAATTAWPDSKSCPPTHRSGPRMT